MATPLSRSLPVDGIRRRFMLFALAYILVWIAGWQAASVAATLGPVSLWYLPAGLRFSCLLVLGWLGLWLDLAAQLCLMLLNLVLNGASEDIPWHLQLFDKVFNLLVYSSAYAMVVLPLRWRLRGPIDFAIPAHSLMFVVAALGASALAAVAGSGGLVYAGVVAHEHWMRAFVTWLIGDFIGVITLSPLLLVMVVPRIRHLVLQGHWPQPLQILAWGGGARAQAHGLTALTALVALTLVLGLPQLLGFNHQPALTSLLLLLPLFLVAQQFKLCGAVLAVVLLDGGVVMMVALQGQQDAVMQYQLVMIAIALVGLWLGGAAEAVDRVMSRLQDFSSTSNEIGRAHV